MNLDQQPTPDNTAQEVQFPKKKQVLKPIPRPHKGMFIFGVDKKTGKAEQIVAKTGSLPILNAPSGFAARTHLELPKIEVHSQIEVENLWYCWAINKTNAEKKYRKAVIAHRKRIDEQRRRKS